MVTLLHAADEEIGNLVAMQIKIGFAHQSRELLVTSPQPQEDIVEQVRQFLQNQNPGAVLELEGAKGERFVLVREHVAYVEVGTPARSSVGFISASQSQS